MASPHNRIYIEECKSQKGQGAGDFICQIKQIVDTIIDGRARGWELIDLDVSGDG